MYNFREEKKLEKNTNHTDKKVDESVTLPYFERTSTGNIEDLFELTSKAAVLTVPEDHYIKTRGYSGSLTLTTTNKQSQDSDKSKSSGDFDKPIISNAKKSQEFDRSTLNRKKSGDFDRGKANSNHKKSQDLDKLKKSGGDFDKGISNHKKSQDMDKPNPTNSSGNQSLSSSKSSDPTIRDKLPTSDSKRNLKSVRQEKKDGVTKNVNQQVLINLNCI